RVLNKALMPLKFRMLTPRRFVQFIRPNDCFITIDLKDAYFHVPIHHRHRRFLRFAFGGIAYQFNALPFGLALAPRVFTKCVEAAIDPLRLRGLRLFNYLDDWLLCARSRAAAVQDCHLVVAHLYRPGFVINKEKSVLRPGQTAHFLGMFLDSDLNEGQSVSRPNKSHQIMRASVQAGDDSLVPVLPKAAGHDGISRNRSPSGDVAYAAFSDVVLIG